MHEILAGGFVGGAVGGDLFGKFVRGDLRFRIFDVTDEVTGCLAAEFEHYTTGERGGRILEILDFLAAPFP